MTADEPTMLTDQADAHAIRLLLDGTQLVVDEIRRLRADVIDPNRDAKLAAVIAEFNRRVDQLRDYAELLGAPIADEEGNQT